MKSVLPLVALALAVSSQTASALTLHFDYSYDGGFFSGANLARRNTLEAAGNYFSQHLQDSLSAIDSSGVNRFDAVFTRPDTGAEQTLTAYDVAADTLTLFVGGEDLGTNVLGSGGPGGYSASGTQAFLNTVVARGEPGALASPETDFAPWGGSISFDADSAWYFDADTTTSESFSGFDFYSVAIHEIGHVLGIGTSNSWSRWVVGGAFTGLESKLVNGGNNILLSADGGHWQSGQTSTVGGQGRAETAMDPEISGGVRKTFTDLDWAALKDIGWEVATPVPTAVPFPAPALVMLAFLIGGIGKGLIGRPARH